MYTTVLFDRRQFIFGRGPTQLLTVVISELLDGGKRLDKPGSPEQSSAQRTWPHHIQGGCEQNHKSTSDRGSRVPGSAESLQEFCKAQKRSMIEMIIAKPKVVRIKGSDKPTGLDPIGASMRLVDFSRAWIA
jgi:hypothetical protein